MLVIVEDLLEKLGVMLGWSFDIMSDMRSNDIQDVFGGYVKIFVFNDVILFLK
jgi:hypothetical protein